MWLLEHKYSKTKTANFVVTKLSDWGVSSKYCVDAGDKGMTLALGSKELDTEDFHVLLRMMLNLKVVDH